MLFGYKILVLCTSKIQGDRFCNFIKPLNDKLVPNNWRVMTFCTETDLSKDNKNNNGGRNIFELINYDIADAIVISENDIKDQLLKNKIINRATSHNIPVIMIEGNNPSCYNICFSRNDGFRSMICHVLEHHKVTKIHFMAGTVDSKESNERLEIFKQELKKHDIFFSQNMVSYGDFWDAPTRTATQKIIDSGNIPEAIICANDTMAITVISVFRQNGYDCPKDIIVTGFDGIKAIYFSNPKITSTVCDHGLLGEETAEFIFEITNNNPSPYTKYVDASVLVSESCGCKPVMKTDSLEFITYLNNSFNRFREEDISLNNMSVLIHDCKNIDEVIRTLNNNLLYNVFCCIKAECLDDNTDPNLTHSTSTYGNTVYVMLDSDNNTPLSNNYIKTSDLIPRMEEILDNYKMPLFFTPINNIDLPLGYLCFCFNNYDQQNYTKVNQIASWLSNAFSGYRNMQYQRHLQKKIESMYQHDTLTNLLNRNGFSRIYNKVLEDSTIKTISLAMCDLDNLKQINDNYSHNEGDEAIKVVAEALSQSIPDGYFCRYGGDEIIGLYTYPVDEKKLTKNLNEFIKNYNQISNKPYEVSTSVGVYTSKKISFEEMFAKADKLMYEQKILKKNRRK